MSNQLQLTGGAKVRDLQDVIIGTSGVLSSVAFNVANGVPKLDVNGKILVSQLPNSVMEYKGVWNAASNSPTLTNGGAFNQGDVYLCDTAGTVNFGSGAPITFAVGDSAIYSSVAEGSVWQKSGGATGTVTSVAITESGDSLNITGSPINTSGTINIGFNGTNLQYVNGAGNLTTFPTLMTSVGLTMPTAFTVTNSPLTGAGGTLAVTGAGYASQYIRGDGTLADFPSSGGGGSSVSYYLNGGTSQGTIGGTTYYEMSKTAVIGTGVDFAKSGDGFIVAFLTDANDPAQLNIPAGNWNYEIYASMSSNGGTPQMYAELYKYDGTTFTLIATSSNEIIYDGTALNLYTFAMAVPDTSLTLTDRLAVKLYATNSGGKTTTIHTQDGHLCQIITTFSTGITALNGLTAQVQYFQTGTSGTDFNISSTTATHTFNIPDASASARGLITTGTQTIAGAKTFSGYTTFTSTVDITSGLTFSNSGFTLVLQPPTLSVNRTVTLPNGTGTLALTSDLTGGTVTSVGLSAPTGFSVSSSPVTTSGTLALAFASGYSLPTNIKQSNWDDAYTFVAAFPTQTGNSGKYLTTNGSSLSWATITSGTVTSVGLSSATSGVTIGSSPVTTSGTITIAIATATTSQNGLLSSTDWTTFNNKQSALTNPVLASGTWTSGYLPKINGTYTIGNSLVYDNATNVGIGTALPTFALDLQGEFRARPITSYPTGQTGKGLSIRYDTVGANDYGYLVSYDWTTSEFKEFRFDSLRTIFNTGNVLINTTNDTNLYKLDVNGTGRFSGMLSVTLSSGNAMNVAGNAIFRGDTGIGTPRQLIIQSGGSTPVYLEAKGYGANYQTDFGIRTYNSVGTAFEVFYADANGRVGINQVVPAYQLDVNGTGRFSGAMLVDGGTAEARLRGGGYGASYNTSLRSQAGAIGVLQFGNNGDNYILAGNTAAGGYLIFRVNCATESIAAGSEALRLASTGAATFSSSVRGTGFYTSSSFRNYLEPSGIRLAAPNDMSVLDVSIDNSKIYIGSNYYSGGSYLPISLYAGNFTQLYLATSGNVGIGTPSPVVRFQVKTATDINLGIQTGTADTTGVKLNAFNDAGSANIPMELNGSIMILKTGETERMRITSGGNVLIGSGATDVGALIHAYTADNRDNMVYTNANANLTYALFAAKTARAGGTSCYFYYGEANSVTTYRVYNNGNVQNTNNSYGQISDITLKKDIVQATSKLDDLMKVNIVNFKFINDVTNTKQIGVIAQELEKIFPSMIDIDTNTKIKSVKYSVFVPMLIKAVQELKQEIETLKNK